MSIELIETDCSWGEPLEQTENETANFISPCPYPQCEMCNKFSKGVCTTPIVITKQNWHILTEKIDALEKLATETEKALYDEILGVNKGYGLPANESLFVVEE